ncbi:hypothetical protein OAM66_02010 [Pelagibacteraceae bacterium]|jgi:hypothetical protein|nr:hypothetical protein [Pelagibacteraceae bacterium]|tara:strand:- start:1932 stop:2111 length:180 start_codon:yes stop_codon:yes gene_type:complete
MISKVTTLLGVLLAIAFLVGLSSTLTRSPSIGFWDILPAYIFVAISIGMMIYDTFSKKK